MRGLIDLAFIIQDYETTLENVKYPMDDFRRISAPCHYTSCEEIKFYSRLAYERNISPKEIQEQALKLL